jgi:hypothetical protein
VEADHVGKLGRRLPALADPAQTLNFKDAASGQFFYNAFGAVQKAVQTGAPITNQPWFENQMGAALAQYGFTFGTATAALLGAPTSCTQLAAAFAGGFFFSDGDTSSEIQTLADFSGQSGVVGSGTFAPQRRAARSEWSCRIHRQLQFVQLPRFDHTCEPQVDTRSDHGGKLYLLPFHR